MKKQTKINDCFIIKPQTYPDHRGVFFEVYNKAGFGIADVEWQQMNCSASHLGVVRGIHIVPFAKLVTCVHGYVWDVVVDMRKDSPTYLTWVGIDLQASKPTQVYVPPGCGHGFMAFEPSVVVYAQTGVYDPKLESSVNWRDPKINVDWPYSYEYIVSPKDSEAPFL